MKSYTGHKIEVTENGFIYKGYELISNKIYKDGKFLENSECRSYGSSAAFFVAEVHSLEYQAIK